MKYFRNNNKNTNPVLSFKLRNNTELFCYSMNDIEKTLCNESAGYIEYEGVTFNKKGEISEITFINYNYDYLPYNFAYYQENLYIINNCNLDSVKFISDSAMYALANIDVNSNGSSPISFPNVEYIGNNFFRSNQMFNSELNLGNKLKHIGEYFMYYCLRFRKPLIFPDTLEDINLNYFLYDLAFFDSYIKLPHHFPELVEKCMVKYNTSESKIMTMDGRWPVNGGWKIKGLTVDEFNKLITILPNNTNRSEKRVLIYDGLE